MPISRPRAKQRAALGSTDSAGAAVLTVNLAAIAANYRSLRQRVGERVTLSAVVKANAYGLGVAQVAPALAKAGCSLFFVATLDEGLALRQTLRGSRIAVLEGLLPGSAPAFTRAKLIPVLNQLSQLVAWRKAARGGKTPPAILHLDTGMSRLGLSQRDLAKLVADRDLLHGVELAAIMSHLACADEPAHPKNPAQLAALHAALALLPPAPASLASSSGIFLGPDYHLDIARPGAALYGINPILGKSNPMKSVVSLQAKILQVRDVDTGETVGYGATHRMNRPSRVATIGVGYADGWLRSASDRGSAGIAGKRVPVVGRISMDLMTLDVTGINPRLARPGATVDLLDENYGIDDAADAAKTIGYELMTLLGRRYRRRYRGGTR